MKKLTVIALLLILSTQLHAQGAERIINHYLAIKDALIAGDSDAAQRSGALLKAALNVTEDLSKAEKKICTEQYEVLMGSAHTIADTRDIEKQRQAFANISPAIWELVKASDALSGTYYYQYCPMRKAYWVSREKIIENPYYGASMLTCGSVKEMKD